MCESHEMGSFGWKQKLFLPPLIKLLQSQTLPAFWAWRRPEKKHEFSKSMFSAVMLWRLQLFEQAEGPDVVRSLPDLRLAFVVFRRGRNTCHPPKLRTAHSIQSLLGPCQAYTG